MSYIKPPIIEAALGIRFDPKLDDDDLKKLIDALHKEYPQRQDLQDFSWRQNPEEMQFELAHGGAKLTALDGVSVVLVARHEFATARLSPYEGWSAFAATALRNLEIFRTTVGVRKTLHLGVRFINRIDVPNPQSEPVFMADYVNVGLALPPTLSSAVFEQFGARVQMKLSDTVRVTLQASTIDDALIGHASLLLDIDAVWAGEMPSSIASISAALIDLQRAKNEVFEACITDDARALFEVAPL